jgi:hypothetical protein
MSLPLTAKTGTSSFFLVFTEITGWSMHSGKRTIQRPESLNPDSIRPTSRRHPIHLSLRLSLAGPTSGVADPGEHME